VTKVRIFVPTFKRSNLLQRALKSLAGQTFSSWICQVHNDDPTDKFPDELVSMIADPRISILNHAKNLGGADTMNAFYAPAAEEFYSILEDDNWWEPTFLEEMLKAAEKHPKIKIFWANMKIWHEEENGNFTYRGETIHAETDKEPYEKIEWGDERQITGAVHSNGACLIRSGNGEDYRIPHVPFATIEMFRERCFPHPLLLVRKPLANFSVTLKSERTNDLLVDWGEATAVLAASFFRYAPWSRTQIKELYLKGRKKKPPGAGTMLSAAILEPKLRFLFRQASLKEILRWAAGLTKRPVLIYRLLFSRNRHPEWWSFLEKHTQERFLENQSRTKTTS